MVRPALSGVLLMADTKEITRPADTEAQRTDGELARALAHVLLQMALARVPAPIQRRAQ